MINLRPNLSGSKDLRLPVREAVGLELREGRYGDKSGLSPRELMPPGQIAPEAGGHRGGGATCHWICAGEEATLTSEVLAVTQPS